MREHSSELEVIAEALLEFENVSGSEVARILEGTTLEDLRTEKQARQPKDVADTRRDTTPKDDVAADSDPKELPGSPGFSPA